MAEIQDDHTERYLVQKLFKCVVPERHVEKLYELIKALDEMGHKIRFTSDVSDFSKMEILLRLWIDDKVEHQQLLKGDMTETYFFFQHCKNKIIDLLAMAIYMERKSGVIGRIGSVK